MFDYFISLGFACPVAASMSKYGLRSCSGPFDWLTTLDFSKVLYHLETDFKFFLERQNLERYDGNPRHFVEKTSGIKFMHDNECFEDEYQKLKDKYCRRIDRFLQIKNKVCYIRRVVSQDEINYIKTNADYIRNVIHKHNPDSDIVFLCDNDVNIYGDIGFRYFKMQQKWSGASRKKLRSYFDNADDFLNFCWENYTKANLIKNLAVDRQKEDEIYELSERRYKTLTALIRHDFSKDIFTKEVLIYGAGVIGVELYKRIREFTQVKYFIDKDKVGETIDNIEVLSIKNLECNSGIEIIVSAAYDFLNIKEELSCKYDSNNIISIDDILQLQF